MARTVLADHWRHYYRRGASVPLDDTRVVEVPGAAEEDASAREQEQVVQQLLAGLPERYRRVLDLRLLQGNTIQETAQELGVTPENVKVIQHRALAKAVQAVEGPAQASPALRRRLS